MLKFLIAYIFLSHFVSASNSPSNPYDCIHTLLGTDLSVKQSHALAEEWMNRRGQNIQAILTNPWSNAKVERNHPEVYQVRGIPAHARLIDTKDKVFRHYANKETIEAIQSSSILISGYLPYVEAAPGVYKKSWTDVTGAFLTLPEVSNHTVGVELPREANYYVDLKVAADIPVIEIEAGHIFVVPLPPNYRPWLREIYRKYKSGETLPDDFREVVENIDARGGMGHQISAVPIEIVGTGRGL